MPHSRHKLRTPWINAQTEQADARIFQYLAVISAALAVVSVVLAVLHLRERLDGFDDLHWLGSQRWYLFGLFVWSLLTITLIGLTGLAAKERDRLATNAARKRLSDAIEEE